MVDTYAFIWQLAKVLILALALGLTVWQKRRSPASLSVVVPIGIGVVLSLSLAIFFRQANGIRNLRNLHAESISSITYKGQVYSDRAQIVRITIALHDSHWWAERSSAMVRQTPLSIHFMDGSDWAMFVGNNRYGPGMIIQMSDRGISSGYSFNPTLSEVLRVQ